MKRPGIILVAGLALCALSACATQPVGPAIAVMPGPYKPFEVFAQDQAICRNYASAQVAGAADRANDQAVAGALIGSGLGAALGAAVGNGRDAAIGAAYGAIAGAAIGASNSSAAGYGLQRNYDIAYQQCMYARGNQVPGYGVPASIPPPPPPGHYRG